MNSTKIKIIECPRDAMQGWEKFIPTDKKIEYLNALLKVGFDTLDFGSFVSSKAIPQMADTKEVIPKLQLDNVKTKLLAIIANVRGAEEAVLFDEITYLGFPFSISETFQQRNTSSGILESLKRVESIQEICLKQNKKLVVYISMGFGNPYGDEYSEEIVFQWIERLQEFDIEIYSLADTVGLATPQQVSSVTKHIIQSLPGKEIGVHLHSTNQNWKQKLEAAIDAGCLRFDGALKGIGGCPMAGNALVGNMDSDLMINYFQSMGLLQDLKMDALAEAKILADEIFIKQ